MKTAVALACVAMTAGAAEDILVADVANVDPIVQGDRAEPPAPKRVTLERSVALDKPYLLFPVRNGDRKGPGPKAAVLVDGAVVREFDIDLADDPGWFAHLNVRAWQGKTAVVRVERIAAESKALDRIVTSATLWQEDGVYRELLRGQLRFSSRRGWNNDPNGMVFAGGEYHLYYQHNPYGWPWGNMHWGHAVSADMVHWREEPVALYPAKHGDWAFSGSAVVDRDNTSGWRTGTNPLIVAAFTSTGRGECIVHSNDRGRSFREFESNPVVKHTGRDPRLLWHAESKQWVMAVYTEVGKDRFIAFHTSPDLKVWTYRSRIAGFYECPDIFELSGKWVLTAANSDYMLGAFDGATFTPETPMRKGHRGRGYYAAQTFSHEPQGRVVQIGWFQTATPGMPFNQSMSLPNELRLVATADGPRMTWMPVKEVASLRAKSHKLGPLSLKDGAPNPLAAVAAELIELRAEIEPGGAAEVEFSLRGLKVVYETAKQELVVNGHRAPAPLRDGKLPLAVYVDRNGSEVYACDGLTFVPMPFAPKSGDRTLSVATWGGPARFTVLDVHELRSIWGLQDGAPCDRDARPLPLRPTAAGRAASPGRCGPAVRDPPG